MFKLDCPRLCVASFISLPIVNHCHQKAMSPCMLSLFAQVIDTPWDSFQSATDAVGQSEIESEGVSNRTVIAQSVNKADTKGNVTEHPASLLYLSIYVTSFLLGSFKAKGRMDNPILG
uniref:SERPIN domain-containing protein n=1 Tax=Panagrellus redivivus TaxID=6233 RepID=A0A7E4V7V3_PANRE